MSKYSACTPRTDQLGSEQRQAKTSAEESQTDNVNWRPIVTVGMPVYNGVGFLERSLSCLVEQTYPDFRLIISDNASTDNTWEILEKYAKNDSRLELHRQQTNIGLRANFQYVLDQAETEFFMWHSDDDWVDSNYLEEVVSVIRQEPSCMLAATFSVRVAQDGTELHREAFPDISSMPRRARIRAMLKQPEPFWIHGLFRADALRRAWRTSGEFPYVWGSDALALLPFILSDQIRGTNRTAFYYRTNMESLHTYRPDTPYKMLRFMLQYAGFNARLFWASKSTLLDKILLWPWVLIHVFESLFEHPFKRFIKHPVKRALRAIGVWPARTATGRR